MEINAGSMVLNLLVALPVASLSIHRLLQRLLKNDLLLQRNPEKWTIATGGLSSTIGT